MSVSYKTINSNRLKEIEILIASVILGFFFLSFEAFIRIRNLYEYLPIVDIPSHLFSGLALGLGFYWLISVWMNRKSFLLPVFLSLGVAVSWEIIETIGDKIIPQSIYYIDYFIWDGFFDIIFTTGGASMILLLIITKTNLKKAISTKSFSHQRVHKQSQRHIARAKC